MRDSERHLLDVIDEQPDLWNRLYVVIQRDLPRERDETASFCEARQDSLVSGIFFCSARDLFVVVNDIFCT